MTRDEEKLSEQLSFRVTPSLYRELVSIARRHRRRISEVATGLIERGLQLYAQDDLIFEPERERRPSTDGPAGQELPASAYLGEIHNPHAENPLAKAKPRRSDATSFDDSLTPSAEVNVPVRNGANKEKPTKAKKRA
jgi:hypothetical protein